MDIKYYTNFFLLKTTCIVGAKSSCKTNTLGWQDNMFDRSYFFKVSSLTTCKNKICGHSASKNNAPCVYWLQFHRHEVYISEEATWQRANVHGDNFHRRFFACHANLYTAWSSANFKKSYAKQTSQWKRWVLQPWAWDLRLRKWDKIGIFIANLCLPNERLLPCWVSKKPMRHEATSHVLVWTLAERKFESNCYLSHCTYARFVLQPKIVFIAGKEMNIDSRRREELFAGLARVMWFTILSVLFLSSTNASYWKTR